MGNNSVPKFIFHLSRLPVYRGFVLGRFYCTTTNFSQNMASHILDLSVMEDGYQHFGRWRQYAPKIWYPCTRLQSIIIWRTTLLIWCDFDRASSLICGNKMPTRSNRGFLLQILLLAQHVSGITMPIIRSSRVLYSGCCLWYFVM